MQNCENPHIYVVVTEVVLLVVTVVVVVVGAPVTALAAVASSPWPGNKINFLQ